MKKTGKIGSLGANLNFNPMMLGGGPPPKPKPVASEPEEERKSGADEYVAGAHKRLSLRPKDRKKPDGSLFTPQEEEHALGLALEGLKNTDPVDEEAERMKRGDGGSSARGELAKLREKREKEALVRRLDSLCERLFFLLLFLLFS